MFGQGQLGKGKEEIGGQWVLKGKPWGSPVGNDSP